MRPFSCLRFTVLTLAFSAGAWACSSDGATSGGVGGSEPGTGGTSATLAGGTGNPIATGGALASAGGIGAASGAPGAGGVITDGASGSNAGSNVGGSPDTSGAPGTGGVAGGAIGGASASAGSGGGGTTSTCSWRNTAPVTVATPFPAPDDSLTFTPPAIPCRLFSITDYGSKSDGKTSNTAVFSQAIAAAKAAGGGVVDVPAGTFLTGAIHLDTNIELHLESGAVIQFSTSTADYKPLVLTRWEGLDVMNWSPMIYALGATNVAITGAGTLKGPGETWGGSIPDWTVNSAKEDQRIYDLWSSKLSGITGPPSESQVPVSGIDKGLRPTFVECNGCTNFLYDGPTLTNAVYWAIHPLYSKNVIVRNAKIDTTTSSANGDGTDPDSCNTTLIDNVTYSTSDDIIAVKSGLNEVGIAVNRPNHNLVVRNVKASAGHGFSIGSEMSGGIDNAFVSSDAPVTWTHLDYLLRIKTLPGRGGVIQNVFFENVNGTGTKNAVLITTNYGSGTISPHSKTAIPVIKNITVKNVSGAGGVSLLGLSSQQLQNITFDTVNITGASSCSLVTGLDLIDSSVGFSGTSCK